jgi:hypothetical protein
MNKNYWMVVHTPADQKNIVCGPFNDPFTAMLFISEDFNYSTTSVHDTLESAINDHSKMEFVPG